ncbi:MAG: MFS transporter [Vallitaleaceae bacterium]|nr:MFS transporter [Vallitaleaceae bacterium]
MKLSQKEKSWILYDCGNSAYSMAITTALFPVYFGMFRGGSGMDIGYFNSIASILVALISPILGTIADYKDVKKRFFAFFALLGIIFTGAIAVVPNGQWQLLIGVYIVTAVGFSGANIFYDAFLVDVSIDANMDSVSTKGFAFGYIASVVPFTISLVVVFLIGLDQMLGYQLGFVITALWWGLFTIPMLRHVRQVHYVEREPQPIKNSFIRLGRTFMNIRRHKTVFMFLIAYFLYIDGVDTIIKMAVPYATDSLGLDPTDVFMLLGILLVIQLIAFPCALLYGVLAKRYSTKKMIVVAIITYIITTIFAFTMTQLWHVFVLGGLIGSAQGGIQALSRSYFAKIIPKNNSNEFFGFYNIFGKFAAIIGPTLMALVATITGVTRYSILAIIPLFILGLILFLFLPEYQSEN